jgi:hypothetical protein
MRQLFSKADLRTLSLILAMVMLLGSSPVIARVAVPSEPNQTEITINICRICQPIQSLALVSGTELARPSNAMPDSVLFDLGLAPANVAMRLIDYRVAPDTPPPKSPVS